MKKSYLALIIALLSSCGADETLTVREESQPVSVGSEFRSPAEVLAIAANVLLCEGEDLTDQHHIHWGYGINSAGYYDQKIFKSDKVSPSYNYTVYPEYFVITK